MISLHSIQGVNDEIELFVEDELKFYGRPGLVGKYRGVEVLSRVYSSEKEVG